MTPLASMLRWKILPKPASALMPSWMRAPPESFSAHLERLVLNFADFLGHSLGERAAVDRKVLSEHVNEASVDRAASGYDTIAQVLLLFHAEVMAAMKLEHVHLLETALVQQHVDALAGRVFTPRMLFLNGFFAATHTCLGTEFHQFLDSL